MDALDALGDLNREEHPGRIIRDKNNPPRGNFANAILLQRQMLATYWSGLKLVYISPDSDINFALSSVNRLLLPLRFHVSVNFQITDENLAGVHQTTRSRIVKRVSAAIARRTAAGTTADSMKSQAFLVLFFGGRQIPHPRYMSRRK